MITVSQGQCTIDECGRPVSAAGLCATHRRRKRLKLRMHAPIRTREVTLSDLLIAAREVDESDSNEEFERLARRFRRLVRKWAACP